MAKKGVFPIILGETHSTGGAITWGQDTSKEVGVIKITANHAVTFDSTNYPGEPGDCVTVYNAGGSSPTVTISPDPFGDETMNVTGLSAGESCSCYYHETHGWIWFGGVQSQ